MNLTRFSASEIAHLIKSARRVLKHPGLDILMGSAAYPQGRLLVITPKRITHAPGRNRIRRQLKALFHEEKLATCGIDCIIIIKKAGLTLDYAALKALILPVFYEQSHSSA